MNNMPAPVKQAKHCNLDQLPDLVSRRTVKMMSIFEQKRIKGIWPCFSDKTGERELMVSKKGTCIIQGEIIGANY